MRRPIKNRNKPKADLRYDSERVGKFINYVMERGKKNTARAAVYGAFDEIAKETKKEPLEVFEEAIQNVGPMIEVRSKRVGGANYQVPHEVRPERRITLAFRWILQVAKARKGVPIHKKLADELILASQKDGEAFRKKENVHKMAEANRAFAHFAMRRPKKKVY